MLTNHSAARVPRDFTLHASLRRDGNSRDTLWEINWLRFLAEYSFRYILRENGA